MHVVVVAEWYPCYRHSRVAWANMEGCETLYKTGLAHLNYRFLRSEDSRIIIPWETRVTSSNEGAPGTLTNPLHVDSNSGSNTATPLATPGPQTTIHRPASPHQEVASSTRSSGIANGGPREKTSIEVTKSRLVMLKVDRTRLSHLLTQGGHEGTETVSCHQQRVPRDWSAHRRTRASKVTPALRQQCRTQAPSCCSERYRRLRRP